MDAKGCLRTPRHSPEKYTTVCKYYGRQTSIEMTKSALGGAKGESGKYLERHSRGRGRN